VCDDCSVVRGVSLRGGLVYVDSAFNVNAQVAPARAIRVPRRCKNHVRYPCTTLLPVLELQFERCHYQHCRSCICPCYTYQKLHESGTQRPRNVFDHWVNTQRLTIYELCTRKRSFPNPSCSSWIIIRLHLSIVSYPCCFQFSISNNTRSVWLNMKCAGIQSPLGF
jgi:hypothetical protein